MRATKCLALLVVVAAAASCKNVETNMAGEEYKRMLLDVKDVMKDFTEHYPEIEGRIDGYRTTDRARVVSTIESEMLPLIDRGVNSLDRAIAAGRNYTGKLDDSVGAKKTIIGQLDRMDGQLDGFRKIRATYDKEAGLFRKPSHTDDDFQAILDTRMAAARYIAGQAD